MTDLALVHWGSWRVPLRMARRTARREPGRALMVIALIALPVAAVAGSVMVGATDSVVPRRAAIAQLGTADAMLTWTGVSTDAINVFGAAPDDGTTTTTTLSPDTVALPSLPAGSRTLAMTVGTGNATYAGRPFRHVVLVETDLRDHLLAGAYTVVHGRLPAGPGEVAVSEELAARIGLTSPAGFAVSQGPSSELRIVGVVRDNAHRHIDGTAYAQPGSLGISSDPSATRTFFAYVPGGLPWPATLSLAHRGWKVTSREVLQHPPAGCADQYCDASGPVQKFSYSSSTDSGTVVVIALATTMALLQIVLLVGPAFAVGLRRRRRDLGLLAVSGARPGQLRRVVLAEGVVLGAAGSVVGVVVAWIAVYTLRGTLERAGSDRWLGLPELPPLLLVVAAFGLGTAVVAAAQPARQAARTDPASAVSRGAAGLSGRGGSRRVRVLGGAAVVLGTGVVVVSGVALSGDGLSTTSSAIPLLLGCITAELGVVALTPTLVDLVARLGRRLPLTPRLALRDAARNRLRSGAAVAAVTAAMAGSVAALLYSASTGAVADRAYRPTAPIGSVVVRVDILDDTQLTDALRNQLARVLPLTRSWTVPIIQAAVGGPSGMPSTLAVVPPSSGRCPAEVLAEQGVTDQQRLATASADRRCNDQRQYGTSLLGGAPVGDGDLLAALTGVDSPAARQVLAAGGAVVFSPYLADHGTVTLQSNRVTDPAQPVATPLRSLTAPVYVMDRGFVPSTVFLSPALAQRLGVTYTSSAVVGTASRRLSRGEIDAGNAVVAATLGPESGDQVFVEQGRSPTSTDVLLWAVVATATFLAVAAAVTASALALSDSRRDLATLAAVGAPPRVRRRLAASQAAVLTLIGCTLGVGAGFLPGWAMVHTTADYSAKVIGDVLPATPLVVPWGWIAVLLAGLPAVTALAVGLAVRSRIPLARRRD